MAGEERDGNTVSVGNFQDVSGEVNIAGGDIYRGYSAEQVSVLITQITSTFQPKPFDGRCPYKGLDVFEEEDAGLFFGRANLVDDLIRRVRDSKALFVTGPSGSGKSSLIRAGLIHALREGATKNSEYWLYATMKPGREPIRALARAVAGLVLSTNAEDEICAKAMTDETIFARWCEIALKDASDKRVVLFIDQFEEVFTQISNEQERTAFLNLLTHAATAKAGRVIILFAMRSDFISNSATYPKLNALLNEQFVQIGAMQPDELVSAIAQPALRVGLRIDPDLIAQIINDMQGEPGALPLMQFALKDLFDYRQSQGGVIALTLEDYYERGGIRKSLERHADDAFAKLEPNEQQLARSVFGGLIQIGRGTMDTRRTALFNELIPANANSEEVKSIVEKLADARLITTDEQAGNETVTISHERLIDAWPWLKQLVNENRDVIALQNEIAGDAKVWDAHQRDASYLYSGARLATAQEKMAAQKMILSGLAHDFIEQGTKSQAAQARAKESLRRQITIGLTAGIALALMLAAFAVYQMLQAQKQARISRAGELAAQAEALINRNLHSSLLLGIEAFRLLDDVRTRGAVLDAFHANPRLVHFLSGYTGPVYTLAFSPDGKTLASGGYDGTVILWNVGDQQPIGRPLAGHTDSIQTISFSPDGKTLASGSDDRTIRLWDVATGQSIGRPLTGHTRAVYGVAFSPDGKTLASGSWDGTIRLWDVATGQPIGQPFTGHTGPIQSLAFSPDGRMLASGSRDQTIILWNVATGQPIGQPLAGHRRAVYGVAFSPDGRTLASGSGDKTIILWDVASHKVIGHPLTGHTGTVQSVAFSPDGRALASGSWDGTVILWNVETQQTMGLPLTGHAAPIHSLAFSPDGKTLASGSGDKTIILWDVTSQQDIGQLLTGHTGPVKSVAFSPDGKTLASGSYSYDGGMLWNVASQRTVGQPRTVPTGPIYSVAFSPDGKTLASGSDDDTIRLWNVATGQPVGPPLTGHTGRVRSVAFSPDGKILASGSWDGTVILWNVEARRAMGPPLTGHTGPIYSVAFSPDSKTLASGGDDHTIRLWNVATGQPIGQPLTGHTGPVKAVVFSPDGRTLASGSDDKTVILWDVASRRAVGQPLTGHAGFVFSVAFSPDSKTLASGSDDHTVILWDVEAQQAIGEPLTGHTDSVESVAFSPDGKTLASGSDDHTVILWNVDLQYWITQSCQRAGSNFTRAEWKEYGFTAPYRATCLQWPLEPEATSTATP